MKSEERKNKKTKKKNNSKSRIIFSLVILRGIAPVCIQLNYIKTTFLFLQRLTSQESCDKSPMKRMRNAISFGRINEKNKRKSDAFRIYFENEQKRSFFRYHAGAWRFIEPLAPRLRPFDPFYLLIT